MIYVVALMLEGEMQQRKEVLDALLAGDWYTSDMGALATMDQWNAHYLERLTDEEYESGDFSLLGVFKLEHAGLVGSYDN